MTILGAGIAQIEVEATPHEIGVEPFRAEVPIGSTVRWEIRFRRFSAFAPIRARFVFRNGSPFRSESLQTEMNADAKGEGQGTVRAGEAEKPGEYKYDIVIIDPIRGPIHLDPFIWVFS